MVKEAYDWVGAFLLVVLLLPLLIAIAIAIRVDDGGPALIRQTRVGRHDREFRLLRFRSTVVDSDPFDAEPRTSRVGAFLRRYALDELPQLFNVLGGSMAIVGPCPVPPDEAHRRWLLVKPGLTGLWLVGGSGGVLSRDESARLDLRYVENWSPRLDWLVLKRTLGGAYGTRDTC
jgi:lipopolysaccharide/colanic/teichoic acid biosynthesis glycosyltransferase